MSLYGKPDKAERTTSHSFFPTAIGVVVGLFLLIAVVTATLKPPDNRENISRAKTDLKNLAQALKLYQLGNGRYPTAEQGLNALVVKPTISPIPENWQSYLDTLPNDPWGQPYQYRNPAPGSEVDVMSFGADGKPGGTGDAADLSDSY